MGLKIPNNGIITSTEGEDPRRIPIDFDKLYNPSRGVYETTSFFFIA